MFVCGSALLQPARSVCVASERFFINNAVIEESVSCYCRTNICFSRFYVIIIRVTVIGTVAGLPVLPFIIKCQVLTSKLVLSEYNCVLETRPRHRCLSRTKFSYGRNDSSGICDNGELSCGSNAKKSAHNR